ncbi:hypothetical protein EBU99_07110 [bacterium]|nr:hypothetical protein [bacterium]
MHNAEANKNLILLPELTDIQRHDLNAAVLSIRWSAEFLESNEESQPPRALIAAHLRNAYNQLAPFIESILKRSEGQQP